MLRVSKLTDYATVVMTCLVASGDEVQSAQCLAERAHLEVPTVSKLLKQLAQAGLVVSMRGINGGYRLARAPERISIAAIVTAMRAALGVPDAAPAVAPFACDAFMFSEHGSTPVVVCGPGGHNPHAPDEYVVVEDLHTLTEGYVRLALDWCGAP